MLRLLKRPVLVMHKRTLFCDSHCLRAKFLIGPPNQKVAQKAEPQDEWKTFDLREPRTGMARLQGRTVSPPLTPDTPDRFPRLLPKEPKVRKGYNLLSQRRAVNPARLQYVQERQKQLLAEVELRRQNAKPFVTRQALHSGRLDKIK